MDLDHALAYSRYAARALRADPALSEELAATCDAAFAWPATAEQIAQDAGAGCPALEVALRRLRRRVFLHTLVRDLTGRAGLDEVVGSVTRLAEVSVDAAVTCHAQALAERHGTPIGAESGAAQSLIVIGMGKLGGSELNVSSDIDLVFAYPEDGDTDGARPISNAEFFERLGRRVIAALHQPTVDGYVFRVDMRLRPYGDSGPLCASFAALEQYLVTQGRAWERYAWLKARPLTGHHHPELAALIEPFVYRKYLDYDAYEGLRSIHRQIRAQERREDYGLDIKLGRGGIREIEFIVQALQIVRGGREPSLRVRGTRAALRVLGERRLLAPRVVRQLLDAYGWLRAVEHRLQYRDDQQTQRLPVDLEERTLLAAALALRGPAAMVERLDRVRLDVSGHFDSIFGATSNDDPSLEPFTTAWEEVAAPAAAHAGLAAAGYDDPASVVALLERTRAGARYRQLPALSRQRFDDLVPRLLAAAARERVPGATPQVVFERLLALLEAVSRRSAYLALLIEHPPLLPRLVQLMGASGWAADYLTRHPVLLDELLDARVLLEETSTAAWRDELARQLATSAGDPERQMDALRHFKHAQTLRLLAQDVAGVLTVERLADHLSALADVVLDATVRECWPLVPGAATVDPGFAVIAYGRLGGKELGYASDLDLVFVYTIDAADPDAGRTAERYARLAQRINTWLTSTTPAGQLYETDLRLRPDGAAGLLVTSLPAFRAYQRDKAWTWEHQALTRARPAAGDATVGAAFEVERAAILCLARDPELLAADIVAMRTRMAAGHPNRSPEFDLKHDPGGMVDIEFIVQYLVLAHAHRYPALTQNLGNIALLGRAADLSIVPRELAAPVADAYREYRRLQHQARLTGAAHARVAPAHQAERRQRVHALWRTVFGAPWSMSDDGTGAPSPLPRQTGAGR